MKLEHFEDVEMQKSDYLQSTTGKNLIFAN